MAIQILSTQFDARKGKVARVRLRRLDATRLEIVHEGPVVSPWVYIIAAQDFQAVVCRKTGCGTRQTLQNVASHGGSILRGARSPGHGREPQQEDERRLREPHVAVSPPRGRHNLFHQATRKGVPP